MQENVVVLLHDRKVNKMENLEANNMRNLRMLTNLLKKMDRLITNRVGVGHLSDDMEHKIINECLILVDDEIRCRELEALGYQVERQADGYEVQEDAGPLEFTIDLMRSGDYKERFQAEYHQTKIRYDKLHKMLIKAEAGTLDFKPTCSLSLLTDQKHFMGNYLHVLEVRAEIEGIEL